MIKDNEDLVLMFNPFICDKRKIPMKFKNEFVKLSKDIINHVPEQNRCKFVTEAKTIFNNFGGDSFFSILEMIEFFHSTIRQNSVRLPPAANRRKSTRSSPRSTTTSTD